jgi:RNA polymerase sigma factor (sigma-70 family)
MAVTLRTRARALRRRPAAPSIAALFDEYAPMVLAICRYNLRDPQAAEDAAQETFLAAHRSLLRGTTPREPAAWLATIARNECKRTGRAPRPAPLDEATTASYLDPAEIVADRADLSDVTGAIAELPARQREALVLREFCGLSYEQVAAAMSVSGAAVDSLLSRARKHLVEQLGEIPRSAHGTLLVPAAFREELERLIPGLEAGGAAATAGGVAAFSGFGSAPVVAKVAATCAATIAIGVPVQSTLRGEEGKQADRPAAASVQPQRARPTAAPVVVDDRTPVPIVSTGATTDDGDSSGPGSGDSGSSGSGSGSSGSGSSGPGSGSEDGSDVDNSGPGSTSSGSGSSGGGSSGSSSSGHGSGSGGSGSSGSGSSGSGSSGSGSDSSGPGSGDDD